MTEMPYLQLNIKWRESSRPLIITTRDQVQNCVDQFMTIYSIPQTFKHHILNKIQAEIKPQKFTAPESSRMQNGQKHTYNQSNNLEQHKLTQNQSKSSQLRSIQTHSSQIDNSKNSQCSNLCSKSKRSLNKKNENMSENNNSNKSQAVYEKWKKLQKMKKPKQTKKNSPKKQDGPMNLSPVQPPGYFYDKGRKLQLQKQHKIYRMKQESHYKIVGDQHHKFMDEKKKQQLHDRLFKDSRKKQTAYLKQQVEARLFNRQQPLAVHQNWKIIKQKVAEEQAQLDEILFQMVQQKMLTVVNPTPRPHKSPFRKVQLNNVS